MPCVLLSASGVIRNTEMLFVHCHYDLVWVPVRGGRLMTGQLHPQHSCELVVDDDCL